MAPPNIQFNVHIVNKATQQPVTTPLVVRVDAGLSGTVRNTNPANFFYGPPKPAPWIGDIEVIADGYAPFSTGAAPQVTFQSQDLNFLVELTPSFRRPFRPAPRVWAGNMCGIRVIGAPAVPGGADDPSLILSWFYDRYDAFWRAEIRAGWHARGLTHVLVSWPDSQDYGYSPAQFRAMCLELIADGFFPCVFLCAKPTSADTVRSVPETLANILLVLPSLVGLVPMFCIGWELSLWLTPTDVQFLIDQLTPLWLAQPGTLGYVHFQEGYPSFQQPGHTVADFWWPQVGKLTGLLYQKLLSQNAAQFLDSISDNLQRFCGGFNMPDDSGFDHPFDWVACELSAQPQFNRQMTEAQGNSLARLALNAPSCFGPNGVEARVMGSGNGV